MFNKKNYRRKNLLIIPFFIFMLLYFDCFATDADFDGIDDKTEFDLLNRHAPKLIFHPDEKERPYRIEDWFCKYQINLEKEYYS